MSRVPGAEGVTLGVRIEGDAAAPSLVLLHALGESADSWTELLPRFTASHRVFAFDLRGHGESDWPGAYSPELMRADVVAALDALGIAEFVLLGHSLGGAVALLLAEDLEDRITRLVLEDVVPPYPREPRPAPERPDEDLPFDWAVIRPIWDAITDPDLREWPALATISAPTLVVAGGPTSHIPGERITRMAELIPDCTVRTIDAGHHVHVNAPAEFADTVLAWLAR